jgi:hypothetical protein
MTEMYWYSGLRQSLFWWIKNHFDDRNVMVLWPETVTVLVDKESL